MAESPTNLDSKQKKKKNNNNNNNNWVRTKISFTLIRATNLCIRGSRTKWRGMSFEDGCAKLTLGADCLTASPAGTWGGTPSPVGSRRPRPIPRPASHEVRQVAQLLLGERRRVSSGRHRSRLGML